MYIAISTGKVVKEVVNNMAQKNAAMTAYAKLDFAELAAFPATKDDYVAFSNGVPLARKIVDVVSGEPVSVIVAA